MDFVPFLILLALNKKAMDWLRVVLPDQHEPKVLIPASMAVGVVLALLFSASPELARGIQIFGEHTLATASVWLVVVYGLAVGSGAGILHDAVKPTTPPHDQPPA